MKTRWFFLLFLCLALALCGCSARGRDAKARLDEVLAGVRALPAGRRYQSEAQVWESEALPAMILQKLYRNRDGESAFLESESFALYLATGAAGGEVGVFVTDDRDARLRIRDICRERLALLRASFGEGKGYVLEDGNAVLLFYLPKG